MSPKLSIITINRNNAPGLRKTIESVVNQTSTDFEYIVVDGSAPLYPPGGGTFKPVLKDVEIINQYILKIFFTENGFIHCTWHSPSADGGVGGGFFSEPDSGIYNAMNKGIRMAKGEYVHFLNSGDWLVCKKVVGNMLAVLSSPPPAGGKSEGADILIGNVISIRPDGKIRYNKNQTDVSLLTFYRSTIQHTSAYIRRSLFDKYGLYDESLKIVADWKWYLIVAGLHKANVVFTGIPVSYFDTTGISSTNVALDKVERRRVLEDLIPAPILADYDKYHFDIVQMERIKRYPLIYTIFWLVERCLFKIDKWKMKYWGCKRIKKI